jgi:hypothetical protein
MNLQFESTVDVLRSPADCFAFLDDFSNAPRWDNRCIELRATSPAPHEVGTGLHYRYKEPGREGTMTGSIREHEPAKRLTMVFNDDMIEVIVAFRLEHRGSGAGPDTTRIVHNVSLTPKALRIKLMAPVIKLMMEKQVRSEAESVKRNLEVRA